MAGDRDHYVTKCQHAATKNDKKKKQETRGGRGYPANNHFSVTCQVKNYFRVLSRFIKDTLGRPPLHFYFHRRFLTHLN